MTKAQDMLYSPYALEAIFLWQIINNLKKRFPIQIKRVLNNANTEPGIFKASGFAVDAFSRWTEYIYSVL